jgi:membrane-bound lytic murein transglycosylase B
MLAGAALAALIAVVDVHTSAARAPFAAWLASLRSRVLARGVSAPTYDRVTRDLAPDMRALDDVRAQPEFQNSSGI